MRCIAATIETENGWPRVDKWICNFFGFFNTIGPHINMYLWWNKYLTAFQMIQFVMIGVHSFQLLYLTISLSQHAIQSLNFDSLIQKVHLSAPVPASKNASKSTVHY
uniref:Uncharacterized protein n=1 Tax=Tetranychus urticae TaxID=32264 RepID=T1K916_TETUR